MPVPVIEADTLLFIMLNAGSGNKDAAATRATIEQMLAEAGRTYELIMVEDPAQLQDIARRTVEKAQQQKGIVVVGGGDGATNTVAQVVLNSGCAFGVLPQGTFNYFSRNHGIPADTAEAMRLLLTAQPQPVQVGLVNDKLFLVNASLGLYPQVLEDREAYKHKFGRNRMVAFAAGIITALRHHRQLHLTLEQNGQIRIIRTPTLFVGNNRLQLEQLGIPQAEALEEGQLAAITLRPVSTLGMLWLILCGTFGRLGEADKVVSFSFRQLKVRQSRFSLTHRVKVATDGETYWINAPLVFRVSPKPLYLIKPETAHSAEPRTGLFDL
ncbi:MAG TPA: diacylglycerol kinase family protein [Methylophilaceae bacterium]|nr:diacylglycerol kinase family protein [Methylophilaceae bacterium]